MLVAQIIGAVLLLLIVVAVIRGLGREPKQNPLKQRLDPHVREEEDMLNRLELHTPTGAVIDLGTGPFLVAQKPERDTLVIMGSPGRRAQCGGEESPGATLVTEGQGQICPCVKLGDIFTAPHGSPVMIEEFVYGNGHYAVCEGFRCLKLIRASDWKYYSPAIHVPSVDCNKCPVIYDKGE